MITHCPSCRTHFRVQADQLAARAGQVRCGKCSRVFDALEHLIEEVVPTSAIESFPKPSASSADAAQTEQTPESTANQALEARVQESAIAEVVDCREESPVPEVEASLLERREPVLIEPPSLVTEADAGASPFNFGSSATKESAPPRHRWPWRLGALLLFVLLLAQAAYQYRTAFILLFPEAKPSAAALCASLGCDLPLPRRIEQLSIDASDLQADTTNPNVMVLSATLKNRAIFAQQHPMLELTLTDAQDQAVVRRVLAPQDYLARAVSIHAGFAANSEIAIKVFIEGSQVKATGYRLYLFYP